MTELESSDWSSWCETTTTDLAGRQVAVQFADQGIGEVQLTDAQRFVSIEYEKLGPAVAFTIRFGDGVVPRQHVVAAPRDVRLQRDADGSIEHVLIEDSTGRRTVMSIV